MKWNASAIQCSEGNHSASSSYSKRFIYISTINVFHRFPQSTLITSARVSLKDISMIQLQISMASHHGNESQPRLPPTLNT